MEEKAFAFIATRTGIDVWKVGRTVDLIESGNTVPFIARYRKESTGELDEEQIIRIRDLNAQFKALVARKEVVMASIEGQGSMTEELRKAIEEVDNLHDLEDIYLPFKPKRRTRAMIAREKGLEALARAFYSADDQRLRLMAQRFVNAAKGVASIEDALSGASDIVAEEVSENLKARNRFLRLFETKALVSAKVVKGKEEQAAKYRDYFTYESSVKKISPHHIHALFRAETEEFLRLKIAPGSEEAMSILKQIFRVPSQLMTQALEDSWKRLLQPSLETRIRQILKEKADREALRIFVSNLRQLLMQPPLGRMRVLAIDPGFKSGCKIVCLDEQGKLLHNTIIFPHAPQNESNEAAKRIRSLVEMYHVEAIAVGNGTAGRETEAFLSRIPLKKDLIAMMVDESGASVYSASGVAREEFPDYDVTVRGAVSIGRRLMDPLAELVKIEPQSIGVGQYQHDVDQNLLSRSLGDVVTSCVNQVGVDLNTASKELLTYVSGLGTSIAGSVIAYRNGQGPFNRREELMKVPRLGPRVYEQAAGFLRIQGGSNPLDASAVHPERYALVARMAADHGCTPHDLIGNTAKLDAIDPHKYQDKNTGLSSIRDILAELRKPGRDPRKGFEAFAFDPNVRSLGDLREGMVVPGIVTNITAFGAFVDIGIKEKGLIHKSQMAERFVSNPSEVVTLHQKLKVRVVEVDAERKRIQLSLIGI